MKYIRLNRGKEKKLLDQTLQHNNSCGRIRTFYEKMLWKFKRKAYCPSCNSLQKFDVRTLQNKYFDSSTGRGEVVVVGIIHQCNNCKLEIRKGLDETSDKYIGGMFKPIFGLTHRISEKKKTT